MKKCKNIWKKNKFKKEEKDRTKKNQMQGKFPPMGLSTGDTKHRYYGTPRSKLNLENDKVTFLTLKGEKRK